MDLDKVDDDLSIDLLIAKPKFTNLALPASILPDRKRWVKDKDFL